jgi:hypothetical protein
MAEAFSKSTIPVVIRQGFRLPKNADGDRPRRDALKIIVAGPRVVRGRSFHEATGSPDVDAPLDGNCTIAA